MARVSTNADAAAQGVELLLSLLAAAVLYTQDRTDSLRSDANGTQAGGHHVA
jgi:hypothetical protein